MPIAANTSATARPESSSGDSSVESRDSSPCFASTDTESIRNPNIAYQTDPADVRASAAHTARATSGAATPAPYAPARRAVSRHDTPSSFPAARATTPAASASPNDCFTSSAVAAIAPAAAKSHSRREERWRAITSRSTDALDGTTARSSAGVKTDLIANDEASTALIPAAQGAARRPPMRTASTVEVTTSSAAATAPSRRMPA